MRCPGKRYGRIDNFRPPDNFCQPRLPLNVGRPLARRNATRGRAESPRGRRAESPRGRRAEGSKGRGAEGPKGRAAEGPKGRGGRGTEGSRGQRAEGTFEQPPFRHLRAGRSFGLSFFVGTNKRDARGWREHPSAKRWKPELLRR